MTHAKLIKERIDEMADNSGWEGDALRIEE